MNNLSCTNFKEKIKTDIHSKVLEKNKLVKKINIER